MVGEGLVVGMSFNTFKKGSFGSFLYCLGMCFIAESKGRHFFPLFGKKNKNPVIIKYHQTKAPSI